jgi:8-oxo-dGTP pyrophosphatase MutT (NUDIX family)
MTTAWEGERFSVRVEGDEEIVDTSAGVAIVPVDGEGRVVLVRQKRKPVGETLLELPAGIVDHGERPEEAARRELAEETGLRGGRWRELRLVHPSPGFLHEPVTLFLAEELEEGEQDTDPGEELEIVRLTRDEAERELERLSDLKTLAGLLLYLRR